MPVYVLLLLQTCAAEHRWDLSVRVTCDKKEYEFTVINTAFKFLFL